MISIRNLSKYYKTPYQEITALSSIDLQVKPKEIFGIIGRSGAGKSTLIRCVNMLERPSTGSVMLEGTCLTTMNAAELREARKQMGMIFQHFNLLQSRNVFDNIALPLEFAGLSKTEIKSRVHSLLELTELTHHVKQYPSQLSGGQQQRVAIARALANSPKVLLSDEATSALDPQSTLSILKLLKSIQSELGLTILLITHEMDVVKAICDRVAIIDKGCIIEQSEVYQLFTQPRTKIAQDLVKASIRMEIPKPIKERLRQKSTQNYDAGMQISTLIRVAYHDEAASQPIISYLIQQYRVLVNILQANIETIQNHTVGVMMVEIQGEREQVEKGTQFLKENGLKIEMLGYVQRNP